MAQYIKPQDVQDGEQRYEVVMLAAGKDGNVVESANPLPVTGADGGSLAVSLGGTNVDAFGRLRVSQPFTLFDSSLRYADNGKFDTSATGTGTSLYNSDNSMSLSVAGTGSVVRETKRVFPYQPGKSLLILNTFSMNTPVEDLKQRVGYFGTQNGIFLETDDEEIYIVKRNAGVDVRVAKDDWNTNTLPTLDISKSQIFFIDIEWLGVGSVRTGFVIDGEFIITHVFHHANVITGTYMQTAVLPVRYEIISTGATATMKQICSSVMSEGGYELNSQYYFGINAPSAGVDLGTAGTLKPLISIRLKSSQLDAIILPAELDMLGLSNASVRYTLLLNATLTNASFVDHPVSQVQVDTTASALTGGTVLQQGFITNSSQINVGGTENFNFQLGRTISGTSDVITLAATGFSNNTKAVGSLSWFQIT
jgi:hypothetical protein